jgi:hypothetical protein
VKFIRGSKNLGKPKKIAFFGADMSGRKCRGAKVGCANVRAQKSPTRNFCIIMYSEQ